MEVSNRLSTYSSWASFYRPLLWLLSVSTLLLVFSPVVHCDTCSRSYRESYSKSYSGSHVCYSKGSYTSACGTWGWSRCNRYRKYSYTCYTTDYTTDYRYRTSYYCCSGWSGIYSSCTTPICSPSCKNGGRCSRPGVCTCPSGYEGSRCELAVCTPPCQNGGRCFSPGLCACSYGYDGSICQNPICSHECLNGGRCLSPEMCTCTDEYSGNQCQHPVCSQICENGGSCTSPGICACLIGYMGSSCENDVNLTCPVNMIIPVDAAIGRLSVFWSWPNITGIDAEESAEYSSESSFTESASNSSNKHSLQWDLRAATVGGERVEGISTHDSGDTFDIGRTLVVYSVIVSGNSRIVTNCSFDIQVEGVSVSCPSYIQTTTNKNADHAVVNWTDPSVQGGEGLVWTNSSHHTGMTFDIGSFMVTYTVYSHDGKGVTGCSFNITVDDTQQPEIACPEDIYLMVQPDEITSATWKYPVSSDNSGYVGVTSTHDSGASFLAGSTPVMYTAIDPSGNINTCLFYVNVTVLNLICPTDINILTEWRQGSATVDWNPAKITIDGQTPTLVTTSSSRQSGDQFQIGVTNITIQATGLHNEVVTNCSFTVTVADSEVPLISCPNDILVFTDSTSRPSVAWVPANTTDNSGQVSLDCSHVPGDVFSLGGTKVSCYSREPAGNQNECHFQVYVEGVNISCPENIETPSNEGSITAKVKWDQPQPTGGLNQTTLAASHMPNSEYPIGSTTVQYIVYGPDSQIITSCDFNITVFDPDHPTIICPEDIYALTELFTPKYISWDLPTTYDYSGTARITYASHSPGMLFPEGNTTVVYEVTDFMDKTGQCSFVVTVEGVLITCPETVNTTTDHRSAFANVTFKVPEVEGGEGVVMVNVTEVLWRKFPIGYSSIAYGVFDTNGTVLTNCKFEVNIHDREAPVIICPQDVVVLISPNTKPPSVSWNMPDVSDNSGVISIITSSFKPRDTFEIGVTNVSYVVSDGSDNSNECTFQVVVAEVTIHCPSDVSVTTDTGLSYASNVTWPEPSMVGYGGQVELVSINKPGESLHTGDHTIIYKALHESGFQTECNFTLSVYEKETPSIVCPEPIMILVEHGTTSVPVYWDKPYVTYDNAEAGDIYDVTSTLKPGELFKIGVTNVSYEVQDRSGHNNGCTFQVIVKVVKVDCPRDFSTSTERNKNYARNITWPEPVVHGFTGTLEMISSRQPGVSLYIGNHSIEYTASKEPSFFTRCNFMISVYDREPPLVQCPDDLSMNVYSRFTSSSLSWPPVVASDNSGQRVRILESHQPGDTFHLGTTTVILTGIDPSKNEESCTFNVTLKAMCAADVTYRMDTGQMFWPESEADSLLNSSQRCSIDTHDYHMPFAMRRCISSKEFGAIWEDPEYTDCGGKVSLTLPILANISVSDSNLVEVAESLSNLTTDMESMTSHNVMYASLAMHNIAALKSPASQVTVYLAETASHILFTSDVQVCLLQNDDVLSTDVFMSVLKSIDKQIATSSRSGAIPNMEENAVFFTRSDTYTRRNVSGNVTLEMKISENADVKASTNVPEACHAELKSGQVGRGYAMLTTYGINDKQLTMRSFRLQSSVIVSPLVSLQMMDYGCENQSKPVVVDLPFNATASIHHTLQNTSLTCVILGNSGNDSNNSLDHICNTLHVTNSSIKCACPRLGIYAALMKFECRKENQPGMAFMFYGKVVCYIVVSALLLSILIVLSIKSWQVPVHQYVMLFFNISLLCLYVTFILIGYFPSLSFGCAMVKAFLYYFIITTLMWSAVEVQSICLSSIKMDDIATWFVVPIFSVIAWIIPLLIVGIDTWLNKDILISNRDECKMTEDIVSHLILIIPAGLILFHNMATYLLVSVRLRKPSRLVMTYTYLLFRLATSFIVFTLTMTAVASAHVWFITGHILYHLIFVISSIVDVIFIFGVSLRLLHLSRKYAKYDIHEASNSTNKGGLKDGVYFTPEAEDLDMTDVRVAQETAMLCNKEEEEDKPTAIDEESVEVMNNKREVDDNLNVTTFVKGI